MGKLNLEPETKCDFYIDTNRKKVWQAELDILEKVIDVCDKNNIKYFLASGTLLGAVRHKGFIPWDDDIDLVMKREDYNRFLEIAEKSIKYPYFLQCYKTEKNYMRGHAQIRNSETTAIIRGDKNNTYNKGIFIDVFPLDNVPDGKIKRKIFLDELIFRKKMLMLYFQRSNIKKDSIKSMIKLAIIKVYWSIFNLEKSILKYEKALQKYDKINTEENGSLGFRPNDTKFKNSWFEGEVEVDFEYLKLKAPRGYHEFLTSQYGDYMKLPENKNGSAHGSFFFDTEKSYKEYENRIEEIVKEL